MAISLCDSEIFRLEGLSSVKGSPAASATQDLSSARQQPASLGEPSFFHRKPYFRHEPYNYSEDSATIFLTEPQAFR